MNKHVTSSVSQKPIVWIGMLVLLALALAACQPAATPTQSAPTATVPPTMAPTSTQAAAQPAVPVTGATTESTTTTGGEVMLKVATDPKLGKILVDGKGMTLYMFTKDTADKSNCAGGCLQAWPPFTAQGTVKAGEGVNQSLIGTATLADGSKIVTYNHMPLYYWAKDTKPGDTTGQDVNQVWYVVSPDGKPVKEAGESKGTPSSSASGGSAPVMGDVMVKVATDAKLGKILVDSKVMTLYMFTKDTPDKSNCTGGCLKAWPPLTVSDKATAGEGVDASLLGTATLADGSKIVTYNHLPLYYWQGDTKPGDATGQGVNNVWFVVSPDGKAVGAGSSTGY